MKLTPIPNQTSKEKEWSAEPSYPFLSVKLFLVDNEKHRLKANPHLQPPLQTHDGFRACI